MDLLRTQTAGIASGTPRRGWYLALAFILNLVGGWVGTPSLLPPASVEAAFPGQIGRIAFASIRVTSENPEGDAEIFTMNGDGTGLRQLTFNDAFDAEPAWSPDRRRIVFTTGLLGGNFELYSMRTDGTNLTRLTNDPGSDVLPDWGIRP
jgi:hypothetical protein